MSGVKRRVLIDGYNVIRRDPSLARLEGSSLELARNTLLALVNGSASFRHDDVTVVFDGAHSLEAGVRGSRSFRRGRVQVTFSPPGQSADEVIKRLAAVAPPGCLVITDDREIRDAVSAAGARPASMAERAPRHGPAAKAPARRPNDTWVKEEDQQPGPRSDKKGNPRKAPRKRNRPLKLDW